MSKALRYMEAAQLFAEEAIELMKEDGALSRDEFIGALKYVKSFFDLISKLYDHSLPLKGDE